MYNIQFFSKCKCSNSKGEEAVYRAGRFTPQVPGVQRTGMGCAAILRCTLVPPGVFSTSAVPGLCRT